MKAFQLNIAEVIAIISCASIGIGVVSGTPEKYKAADGRDYIIESEYKYNWFEAFHECARRDSQLLIIDSEEKNTAIINLLKKVSSETRDLWIGGNDQFISGKDSPFFWATTGKQFKFTYWADKEPNNAENEEHCVHIWRFFDYKWNDFKCSTKMGFICENNPYLETYNEKLKTECDAVNKFNSDVLIKFQRLQKDNIDQLNTKFQTIEQMAKDEKLETKKLQNSIESAVQKLLDHQELTAKAWSEQLHKHDNDFNKQITQSMEQINVNVAEKINASVSSAYPFKNVVIIKQ